MEDTITLEDAIKQLGYEDSIYEAIADKENSYIPKGTCRKLNRPIHSPELLAKRGMIKSKKENGRVVYSEYDLQRYIINLTLLQEHYYSRNELLSKLGIESYLGGEKLKN